MSKAQELIKNEGLVGMIITDPYNMRHISGFRGGEGALYISATQQVLITDSRYTEQAEKRVILRSFRNTADIPENRSLQSAWRKKREHWQSDTKTSLCFAVSSTRWQKPCRSKTGYRWAEK